MGGRNGLFWSAHEKPVVWKGLVAGALGGVGGTLAMTAFQHLWAEVGKRQSESSESEARAERGNGSGGDGQSSEEPATAKAAARLSRGFFGHELSEDERAIAGDAVHYGYGTAVGMAYGAAVEFSPDVARADGLAFGGGLAALSDEVAVPALGLAPAPQDRPMSTHIYSLCSHLVYGIVVEAIRKGVRRALG